MDIVKGSVVISRAGNNKGKAMVAVDFLGETVLLCDGKRFKNANPKRKNQKHVAVTKTVIQLPKTDKQLRKLLSTFSQVN